MRALVLGASGYIGKPLLLHARKHFVAHGTSSKGSDSLHRLRLDVPDEFDYGLLKSTDVVFLAAAISAPDICSREREHAWLVNVTGTSTFISRAIERGARVLFFSSDTVYGEQYEAFDETADCNPAGEYASMKHEIENRFLGRPSFKSIRLSYAFSGEDRFTKYLFDCAARGEEAEIFHPFYRAVVHRDDVIHGAVALAQRWEEYPQSVINFGGPSVIARTELANTLKSTVLPMQRIRQIEPDAVFFTNRPRVIRMQSPLLASLLGRSARTLSEAISFEFETEGN